MLISAKAVNQSNQKRTFFSVVLYRLIQFSLAGLAGFIKFWDRETWAVFENLHTFWSTLETPSNWWPNPGNPCLEVNAKPQSKLRRNISCLFPNPALWQPTRLYGFMDGAPWGFLLPHMNRFNRKPSCQSGICPHVKHLRCSGLRLWQNQFQQKQDRRLLDHDRSPCINAQKENSSLAFFSRLHTLERGCSWNMLEVALKIGYPSIGWLLLKK